MRRKNGVLQQLQLVKGIYYAAHKNAHTLREMQTHGPEQLSFTVNRGRQYYAPTKSFGKGKVKVNMDLYSDLS